MGMYTGLRGWIEIKPEFRSYFDVFNDRYECYNPWLGLKAGPKTSEYARLRRAAFIPYGAVCYMDDSWDKDQLVEFDGERLSFTCSLKNYEGEIDFFIDVLPEFADRWQLEEKYEESEFSKYHFNIIRI